MVAFTCRRCGKNHLDTLEAHKDDDDESYGYLFRIKPPSGWKDLSHGLLLCPECFKAYQLFMNNKPPKEE